MPYVLVSTQIRLETGPTMVGDEYSDPAIMNYLGARKTTMLGNNLIRSRKSAVPRKYLLKTARGEKRGSVCGCVRVRQKRKWETEEKERGRETK
uniref:GTP cyclohydrolase 1 feedback regulatory protein n=1 Tax=Oncorhynchus tshawytscha TaxID=74940 RepID=A0AAZ3PTB9_ONCTS